MFDTQGVERLSWQFADYADFWHAQVVFTDARTLLVSVPSGKMLRWTLDNAGQWQPAADSVRIGPGRYTASAASRDGKIIWLAEGSQVTGIDSATGKGADLTGWGSREWTIGIIHNPADKKFYGKRNDRMQPFGEKGELNRRQIEMLTVWLRGSAGN